MNETALKTQNWEAFLQLELRQGKPRTQLIPRRRYGPLTVQRPFYPEGDCCHVYLLHPPGGIVGGDRLELQANLDVGARALFTTPGATKFYLSAAEQALVTQRLRVGRDAHLEFLPQENIYFPGADARSLTTIDVEAGSRVMLWEKHCFGRPANAEFFASGYLQSRIDLRREGRLLYTETQRIDAPEILRSSGLRGHAVCGSLLVYGMTLGADRLRELQQLAPDSGIAGLTQIDEDLLVARCIASTTRDLDAYLVQLWKALRPTLLRREPCTPRIWNT